MIDDAHKGSADGTAPGLLTWREEGDNNRTAMLGEHRFGYIFRLPNYAWQWATNSTHGEAATEAAARAALSAAVAEWVRRAGLVHKSASYAAMMNDDCDPRSTP